MYKNLILSISILFFSMNFLRAENVTMIGNYQGARLLEQLKLDFSGFPVMNVPTVSPKKHRKPEMKTGEFYAFYYQAPPSIDESQSFFIVKKKLEDMGYKIVSECTSFKCPAFDSYQMDLLAKKYASTFIMGLRQKGFKQLPIYEATESVQINSASSFLAHKKTEDEDTWVSFSAFTNKEKKPYFGYAIMQNIKTPDKVQTFKTNSFSAEDIKNQLDTQGRITLYSILFDFGKAVLRHESHEQLSALEKYLKANPSVMLIVAGHTDNVGGYNFNMELSQKRADAVIRGLQKVHGINPNRLRGVGVGFVAPVSTNNTDEGRAKNRRVELIRWDGK
jgi:outer membrane protein OmpA-like peptidoglycan-associated protein